MLASALLTSTLTYGSVVIDASVWVSRQLSQDVNHAPTRIWMDRYTAAGGLLLAPSILLIEVSAALTRRTGQPAFAKQALSYLYQVGGMRVVPLDAALVHASALVAADQSLRAGDAAYVALAHQFSVPLVSWDQQQLQRASSLILTFTPDAFPF